MEQKGAHLNFGEKLWVWFEANKKQALWGAGIVAVLGLGVWLYFLQESEKETNAGAALSQVMANSAFSGGIRSDPPEAYLKTASQYAGTSAGGQALLLAGEAFFEQGRYAEAQAQFQRFAREYASSPLLPQALLGTATSLDVQGKTEEAARAYKELFERHQNANVAPQAKFSLARIYESQDKLEQARGLYEEISRAETSLGSEAAMRLEEIKRKSPAMTPVVTAPTVSTNLTTKTN